MLSTPNQEIRCARCGTANPAGALVCSNCGEAFTLEAPQPGKVDVASARPGEIEASRFAPTGAAIVMAMVITGFAIMWDSPEPQFQGSDGSAGMLILVLLAVAQIACMAPAVIVTARATLARGSAPGRAKLTPWLVITLGSILTIAGAAMGPALFVWIGGLSPRSFDSRQPLLIAYLLLPLLGVALLYLLAHMTFRPMSSSSATQDRA